MKLRHKILVLFMICYVSGDCVHAQNSFRNFGNLKVFENTELGFQTNLINDGSFDENLGRIGFYGLENLAISGAFVPQFYNFELFLDNQLSLNIPIRISNNAAFFNGNIRTNKLNSSLYTEFEDNSNYEGATDLSKVDGYVLVRGKKEFVFPIGTNDRLRPLHLSFQNTTSTAKSAYFFDDPNDQMSLNITSSEKILDYTLSDISTKEFWHLETEGDIKISLTWNQESELPSFLKKLDRITIAGWNEETEQWDNIGKSNFDGSFDQGSITSSSFNASQYQIFTFAALFEIQEDTTGHYLVSANQDGVNDKLIIPELEQSPRNLILIYNRHGRKIFEKENYSDEFGGFSTSGSFTINREKGLPEGIYFYVAKMYDLNRTVQGFLYLTR